ncbi:hypothetical protein EDD18DRAFT_1365345 [Armillaria luteobubalina]|uniref:Uncharacterized protein n=1 Tax=Armillaria luteobubalina TaxID=153913 RepID=A0AA39P522_9AGAR|nr:hypothetical protein EDD18DRAFT_1365345 [Armillaria luteobubalina]
MDREVLQESNPHITVIPWHSNPARESLLENGSDNTIVLSHNNSNEVSSMQSAAETPAPVKEPPLTWAEAAEAHLFSQLHVHHQCLLPGKHPNPSNSESEAPSTKKSNSGKSVSHSSSPIQHPLSSLQSSSPYNVSGHSPLPGPTSLYYAVSDDVDTFFEHNDKCFGLISDSVVTSLGQSSCLLEKVWTTVDEELESAANTAKEKEDSSFEWEYLSNFE